MKKPAWPAVLADQPAGRTSDVARIPALGTTRKAAVDFLKLIEFGRIGAR